MLLIVPLFSSAVVSDMFTYFHPYQALLLIYSSGEWEHCHDAGRNTLKALEVDEVVGEEVVVAEAEGMDEETQVDGPTQEPPAPFLEQLPNKAEG